MNERIKKSTKCPDCKYELNDDDGYFFRKSSEKNKCPECGLWITHVKQFKRDIGNPYCDYVWNKTYITWGNEDE